MDLNPYVFCDDMSRSNLCVNLYLLERGVQVTTYDFGLMDNRTTNQFDRSLQKLNVIFLINKRRTFFNENSSKQVDFPFRFSQSKWRKSLPE
jgi:hypothetical protein